MAAMNSGVLACHYAISGTGSATMPSQAVSSLVVSGPKLPAIRAQQTRAAAAAASSSANAGVIEEYLEKSKTNKGLNDKKRLATSGANFARAYTVQFGSCKFPENFTGCQDLAKQKKVPFISDDLALECEGKDKYKCGSNVFWKW
ncbi:hypothetical protein OIU78_028271 [Salix suchowensis]|nr:hypothetical protein OIU78_028271 [Salix suchowensis]